MSRWILGIDPGKNGGLALLSPDQSYIRVEKMPETERDLWGVLLSMKGQVVGENCRAVLELVRSSPQMGVVSAFTFGRGVGSVRMALIGQGWIFEEVTPQRWQKDLRCLSKGDKNVTKAKAQELFPSVSNITHWNGDALLIANWGQRFLP